MLYTSTVAASTLGLLKELMLEKDLAEFNLVGGTALSLQIGHRLSYDLDFFGYPEEFNNTRIISLLQNFESCEVQSSSKNILSIWVDKIKVDIVRYRYPLLRPVQVIDNIRLISLEDIAAMKLSAITGRGRKRDFGDLFYLMEHFTLSQMLKFYEEKYHDGNRLLVLKSLDYFEDADHDDDMVLLKPVKWSVIKKTIQAEVKKCFG